ncbi:unnamed protein product, partial [Meganyctiphanes norvegica]
MQVYTWVHIGTVVFLTCLLTTATEAFSIDGYFKLIALTAKKRDFWRKLFGGNDIGFHIYPYFFEDRVQPPEVPIITSKPGIPHPIGQHPLFQKQKNKFHPLIFTPQHGHPMPQSRFSSSPHQRFHQGRPFHQPQSSFKSSYSSYVQTEEDGAHEIP